MLTVWNWLFNLLGYSYKARSHKLRFFLAIFKDHMMLKKTTVLFCVLNLSSAFSDSCPDFADVYDNGWVNQVNQWTIQNGYNTNLTTVGFKQLLILNRNKLLCSYQNSQETKTYINTTLVFKNVLGSNWSSSSDGNILKCVDTDPSVCSFSTD